MYPPPHPHPTPIHFPPPHPLNVPRRNISLRTFPKCTCCHALMLWLFVNRIQPTVWLTWNTAISKPYCYTRVKYSPLVHVHDTLNCLQYFFHRDATAPSGPGPTYFRGFTITLRHTTVGRTARCRDLCLTTHNNHKKETSMSLVGFEPSVPAGERPRTHALDRAATRTGLSSIFPH